MAPNMFGKVINTFDSSIEPVPYYIEVVILGNCEPYNPYLIVIIGIRSSELAELIPPLLLR